MSLNPNQITAEPKVSHESHHFVSTHFPTINHLFSTDNASYEIFKEFILHNNGSAYHIMYLLGKDDKRLYTITYQQ
jgi:hypothetical protein